MHSNSNWVELLLLISAMLFSAYVIWTTNRD
jgi:hypothetical protein